MDDWDKYKKQLCDSMNDVTEMGINTRNIEYFEKLVDVYRNINNMSNSDIINSMDNMLIGKNEDEININDNLNMAVKEFYSYINHHEKYSTTNDNTDLIMCHEKFENFLKYMKNMFEDLSENIDDTERSIVKNVIKEIYYMYN